MPSVPDYLLKVVQGEIEPPDISKFIGFELTSVEYGQAVIELELRDHHFNPFGTVHGGMISGMADSAMGAAFLTTLEEDDICSTLEMKISFFKPGTKGKLRAIGKVASKGQTMGFVECDLLDHNDQLIARATGTFMKMKSSQETYWESPKDI